MTTTVLFRDYNEPNPEYGEFSLDIRGERAVFTQVWQDDEKGYAVRATAEFDHDQARELGLMLIGSTGASWAYMLATDETFTGQNGGTLRLNVVDGYPSLWVGDGGPEFEAWPSQGDSGALTHDMGIRLIVFAGVNDEDDNN